MAERDAGVDARPTVTRSSPGSSASACGARTIACGAPMQPRRARAGSRTTAVPLERRRGQRSARRRTRRSAASAGGRRPVGASRGVGDLDPVGARRGRAPPRRRPSAVLLAGARRASGGRGRRPRRGIRRRVRRARSTAPLSSCEGRRGRRRQVVERARHVRRRLAGASVSGGAADASRRLLRRPGPSPPGPLPSCSSTRRSARLAVPEVDLERAAAAFGGQLDDEAVVLGPRRPRAACRRAGRGGPAPSPSRLRPTSCSRLVPGGTRIGARCAGAGPRRRSGRHRRGAERDGLGPPAQAATVNSRGRPWRSAPRSRSAGTEPRPAAPCRRIPHRTTAAPAAAPIVRTPSARAAAARSGLGLPRSTSAHCVIASETVFSSIIARVTVVNPSFRPCSRPPRSAAALRRRILPSDVHLHEHLELDREVP